MSAAHEGGRGRVWLAACVLAAAAGACADDETQATPLVDHNEWQAADEKSDPFIADKPKGATCPSVAWLPEVLDGELTMGIDTVSCHYVTLTQPSRAAAQAGDVVRVRVWHFDLFAVPVAEGATAVALGKTVLWTQRVPIPSPEAMLVAEVPLKEDAPRGTPVYFQLRNHGANSWNMVEIGVKPPR